MTGMAGRIRSPMRPEAKEEEGRRIVTHVAGSPALGLDITVRVLIIEIV